jgi:hypothetical protein
MFYVGVPPAQADGQLAEHDSNKVVAWECAVALLGGTGPDVGEGQAMERRRLRRRREDAGWSAAGSTLDATPANGGGAVCVAMEECGSWAGWIAWASRVGVGRQGVTSVILSV